MVRKALLASLVLAACSVSFAAGRATQSSSVGSTYVSAGGVAIKLLMDESTIGANGIDIGEITFPAGADSGDHPHGSTEIFYVLSGRLEHVVNGRPTMLEPGMVGFVRPPDRVRHKAATETRALVIWVPGGEAQRIVRNWTRK